MQPLSRTYPQIFSQVSALVFASAAPCLLYVFGMMVRWVFYSLAIMGMSGFSLPSVAQPHGEPTMLKSVRALPLHAPQKTMLLYQKGAPTRSLPIVRDAGPRAMPIQQERFFPLPKSVGGIAGDAHSVRVTRGTRSQMGNAPTLTPHSPTTALLPEGDAEYHPMPREAIEGDPMDILLGSAPRKRK